MEGSWIPLAALVVSIVTMVSTQLGLRAKAQKDDLAELRTELDSCEKRCRQIADENLELMRKLVLLPR